MEYVDKYGRNGIKRPLHDSNVWTNISYLLGAGYAFYCGEHHYGILNIFTFVGSTLYHAYRESVYFNLDNWFALCQMMICTWTVLHSILHGHIEMILLGIFAICVGVFLITTCGLPASIEILTDHHETSLEKFAMRCCRTSLPLYDTVHSIWHLISGIGPLISLYYFTEYVDTKNRIMGVEGSIDPWGCFPIVPTVSLTLAFILNYVGNIYGIMPLD